MLNNNYIVHMYVYLYVCMHLCIILWVDMYDSKDKTKLLPEVSSGYGSEKVRIFINGASVFLSTVVLKQSFLKSTQLNSVAIKICIMN